MKPMSFVMKIQLIGLAAAGLTACQTALPAQETPPVEVFAAHTDAEFQSDRQAILAMAGNYDVTFDFTETVSFVDTYELKEPKLSGAHEVVRVIEDAGDFISLQHILVVGGPDEKFPIKHWRQDWQYEPEQVLIFVGGNAWEIRDVPNDERTGAWSQTVYQVDDSPRYGAVAAWSHENGVSEWIPPAEWRPLPRRDMTTRDDYHAVLAVNRHAITPNGWVHEQDNSKLVLSGDEPQVLVREVGVNTYNRFDAFDTEVADEYWDGTADYWKNVRATWTDMETELPAFGLTLKGEPQDLYMPLMELAGSYMEGDVSLNEATSEASELIARYTTSTLGELDERLRASDQEADEAV